jgi:hypothetical protein
LPLLLDVSDDVEHFRYRLLEFIRLREMLVLRFGCQQRKPGRQLAECPDYRIAEPGPTSAWRWS